MKKRLLVPAILVLSLLGAVAAHAAGGSAADPLISLRYLQDTYTGTVLDRAEDLLDDADAALLDDALTELNTRLAALGLSGSAEYAPSFADFRFKEGDALMLSTGSNVILLAGSAQAQFDSGALIDVTTGKTVRSGTALTADHRYMAAEDSTVRILVTSKTAVMQVMGYYAAAESADTPDYNAMAEALKSLSLLRGSNTGYGSGFDLENVPTRGAALIMFIRLLGEEEQALACTEDIPFTDVAKNSTTYPYVAYAYHMGYTNGYSATTFRPKAKTNARQYTEFILRAMGYSSHENTELDGTLANAVRSGVITAAEKASLENNTFLRADLVYLSYYALQAALPSGEGTLADQLMGQGVFTARSYQAALRMVESDRIA